jgi:MoaA/NifB/PqqE/SkfB family radical SAM enzyme
MPSLNLEVTNQCNRRCLHCSCNTADPPEFLPLELAEKIVSQARNLGFWKISLTGGEVALYPHLEELIHLIVSYGGHFDLVTNGFRFQERLFPLLAKPEVRNRLTGVGLSLDGARQESHDALRGVGSHEEVTIAAKLCQVGGLPLSLKTVLTVFNRSELVDLALWGASFGAKMHQFLYTFPTPKSVRDGIIPDPEAMNQAVVQVANLAQMVRGEIFLSGYAPEEHILAGCRARQDFTVDCSGHLIFCCNLSRLDVGDGIPTSFGRECLADLQVEPLLEGIKGHIYLAAQLGEARINDLPHIKGLNKNPCYWCLKYFGKLDWLKDFPHSPWAAGVLDN